MPTLHQEFLRRTGHENFISESDRAVRSYIGRAGGDAYDGLIAGDGRWEVFYHLSELRTGIISWYDFPPDARVLEIGAGFGALTGRLCRLCAHVTVTERSLYRAQAIAERYPEADNLEIYAGDVADMEFPEKFDVILLIGVLERAAGGGSDREAYSGYLRKLAGFLKEDGRLLIAAENRFGLRYFCGAVEPHTNRAFDGLNRYPNGTGGYSFSRKELEDIAREAGFRNRKFYYPLPDYKLPQLIYTDARLPEKNLKERLIPYYRRNDTLVADEQELYDDVTDNGVFPFFANSFFLECGNGETGRVCYAAVSTDRGEERSYATSILSDGRVTKKPLYEKGNKNARRLYHNLQDLQKHGVPVVPHRLLQDCVLEMPCVELPTLSNYIKELIRRDVSAFLELTDRCWQYILQSSEQAADGSNALLERLLTKAEDGGESLRRLDFGPILRRAYIELIPLNCFYREETGELLYFDQEFVCENYPAKYVLFRAIHYIYCFTPGAERYCPQKELLQRYHLEELWDIFLQEEERFLDQVRSRDKYRQFYRWTAVDHGRILGNAHRLESEEEVIASYKVSDAMKKIWRVELEMLDQVDRICKKHGLTYFLVHGSLLGAVRHKGFIPWDDDLDIGMPRKDYDRFLELAPGELAQPLSLHTAATETDIFWGGCARLRNGLTTGIEVRELGHKGNLGIWIDILPLDVCTQDEAKLRRKQRKIRFYQGLIYARIYGKEYNTFLDRKPLSWLGLRLASGVIGHRRLCRKLDRAMRLYTEEESGEAAFFTGYSGHRRLAAKDFRSTVLLEFEHRRIPVPVGYENYLFMTMGKDYLKYPPEEERKPKHRGVFDPEKPYTAYTDILCDMFRDCRGRKLILFGAGLMFEDYMKKYGGRYRPDFLVDNDENKWGRFRMGIEIRRPEAILEVPPEKRRLIICSYYYREIGEQLEKLGITDYKVYVQNVEWILRTEEQKRPEDKE